MGDRRGYLEPITDVADIAQEMTKLRIGASVGGEFHGLAWSHVLHSDRRWRDAWMSDEYKTDVMLELVDGRFTFL